MKQKIYILIASSLMVLSAVFLRCYHRSEIIGQKDSVAGIEASRADAEGGRKEQEGRYDQPQGYADFYKLITTSPGQKHNGYKPGYQFREYQKIKRNAQRLKLAKKEYDWQFRGPGNVSGRTREVIIDRTDPGYNTWYAAAASGGVWKTTNAGQSWTNLTNDLVNLATNSLVVAPSDPDIIYIGTGEGYGGFGMVSGNGIFKSINGGQSWSQLESTRENENFRWINKILIDESDANHIIVATNEGIFNSSDGGLSWVISYSKGYAVQDLKANPLNSSTIYAALNRLGIIKSYDSGASWVNAFEGIGTGYRFALDISPVDTSYIFTSVEAPGELTEVYISKDGAASWRKMNDSDLSFIHFLGNQGWFNNVIKADPFNCNKVYIGGVYFGSVEFKSGSSLSDPQLMRVDTSGTGDWLSFVDFGGTFLNGGLTTGLEEDADVEEEDFVSVEIRFGPGISQKAHRFTVPEGEGPGVPQSAYTYQDYVRVPFQVWDIDNNRQLMVSFRDQENDGSFNLVDREWDDIISGREYIFAHALDYQETPAQEIAQDGGHYTKMLYFLWPALPEDKTWNSTNLPESSILIRYGTFGMQDATTVTLADDTRNSNLHVDHHAIDIVVTDAGNEEFMMVEANDGGLGVTHDKGMSWEQIRNGYPTTQFYGVAKKPGANEYIGGMQDNGTWQSPVGEEAGPASEYSDRVKGDGFEALWHPEYPQRILASSYYNQIKLSTDGGETWEAATGGISGEGPFITRLSNSPANPDLVFAVGNYGVYRHTNFGVGRYPWTLTAIDTGWAVFDQVTSSHNVEVSLADPSVVWAGGGMYENPDLNIFLSKNYGKSFKKVSLYPEREMGYISGIATHPRDTATAYVLFSMDHKPKILRTEDFGESWEDISGFGADSTSSIFPDVVVYSLLVFPDEPNRIWAGTEIGIIESEDNGASWHMADIGLPAVSVWQMFIQDETIVVATHGRGIWSGTYTPDAIPSVHRQADLHLSVYPNPSPGIVNLKAQLPGTTSARIQIYTLSGQRILQFSELIVEQSVEKQVDLSGFGPGTYLLVFKAGDISATRKLVIQ
ncbi:MAG: T9SS type A sorting domain-containing protein [Bacteroidales bacterium]|nr:T9SS type A sorting domain-containing protein [Bacteroidales bacterium]